MISFLFFSLAIFSAVSFFSVAQARTVTVFRQSILPVRFVYLDQEGEIERIWNNAKKEDDIYLVKFFSTDGSREINPSRKQFSDYQRVIAFSVEKDNFQEGYIFKRNFRFSQKNLGMQATQIKSSLSVEVKFLEKPFGYEEVRTYV